MQQVVEQQQYCTNRLRCLCLISTANPLERLFVPTSGACTVADEREELEEVKLANFCEETYLPPNPTGKRKMFAVTDVVDEQTFPETKAFQNGSL